MAALRRNLSPMPFLCGVAQLLRLAADVIDPPNGTYEITILPAWGTDDMYVMDFRSGEVRFDGKVVGRG
jgi:hypothetical protein